MAHFINITRKFQQDAYFAFINVVHLEKHFVKAITTLGEFYVKNLINLARLHFPLGFSMYK